MSLTCETGAPDGRPFLVQQEGRPGPAMKPALYICFGMAKSGSTLAFELTSAILQAGGVPQPRLGDGAVAPGARINFRQAITNAHLRQMLHEADLLGARPLAIKTHGGVWGDMERAARDGRITGQVVVRDPRDIACSMLDAGREGRAWGMRDGVPITSYEQAMAHVRGQLAHVANWRRILPDAPVIGYEDLAFRTRDSAALIARQLGFDVDLDAAIALATSRFTQFNKGIAHRWRHEMPAEDAARYAEEFADFIREHDLAPPNA
ncbi:hypothetical protein [Brevirhabdus pacifica]|nr:hypothetical protein [Brevirhabdus pacifica]